MNEVRITTSSGELGEAIAAALRASGIEATGHPEGGKPPSEGEPPAIVVVEADPRDSQIEDKISAARGREVRTAVILVGPRPEPEVAVRAMRAGAHDYLFLPLDTEALVATVRAARISRTTILRILDLSDQVHEANRGLKRQAALVADHGRRLEERNRELSLVHEVTQRFSRSLDAAELVRALHEGLAEAVAVRWSCAALDREGAPPRLLVAGEAGPGAEAALDALRAARRLLGKGSSAAGVEPERLEVSGRGARAGSLPASRSPVRRVIRPIGGEGDRAGFLAFAAVEDDRALESRRVVATLVDAASVALANSRRFHLAWERSRRDPLTRLPNREVLAECLDRESQRSGRHGHPLSLLVLDLDRFKEINDRLGHSGGDSVLRAVATILSEVVRGSDLPCRLGGDEFAVLLPDTAPSAAEALAERVRREVERRTERDGSRVTVSVGIAGVSRSGEGGRDLLVQGDEALYDAKRAGRNRVAAYQPRTSASPRAGARAGRRG